MASIAISQEAFQLDNAVALETPESRFNDLADTYSKDLFRYAYWLAGDRQVAEDLVQESLLRAWKSIGKLQNPKAVKGWLLTIVRRENARRFERYQPQTSDIPLDDLSSRDLGYDTSTEAFALRRAVRELPEEYREPLLLQIVGGFSQKEIAEQRGISSAGVGTRLFRARQKLREALV